LSERDDPDFPPPPIGPSLPPGSEDPGEDGNGQLPPRPDDSLPDMLLDVDYEKWWFLDKDYIDAIN